MPDKFILNNKNSVLVIVDIQEKLAVVMKQREKVVNNCLHLIEAAKLLNIPIIVTEQYPKGLGHTVNEIKEALPLYEPLEKVTFDCCKGDGFLKKLTSLKRKQIILTGMETHVCVLQTCLSLLKEKYAVHLVSDAVCSRKKDDYVTGKELMRDAGAVITGTETVLFQLLEKAGTPEFKAIVNRIK
ncbi:MAG: hydrolase [Thermodesulfovibrionia bacterium]|nr:hydrolase [Thermodesulfovibrionia bacterium]